MNRIIGGIAALAIATGLGAAAPAQAQPAPIDGCTAHTDGVIAGTCTFVSTGGTYEVGIDHEGRYGWTGFDCIPLGGYYYIGAWNTEGGRDVETTTLPPGVCRVTVAVENDGGEDGGYGWVEKV